MVCCFWPVMPAATHRAAGSGRPVSRHEVPTVQVCCLRPALPSATHRAEGVGQPTVCRHASCGLPLCLRHSQGRPQCHGTFAGTMDLARSGFPLVSSYLAKQFRRHADTDSNIPTGRPVRPPRPAIGPGCAFFCLARAHITAQGCSS